MSFKIEGWFPPIKFKSLVDGKTYAVCGSNWIEVPESMTSEEIMKGWVCTAKDSVKTTSYKKPTKGSLHKTSANVNTQNTGAFIKKLLAKRATETATAKQSSLFSQTS